MFGCGEGGRSGGAVPLLRFSLPLILLLFLVRLLRLFLLTLLTLLWFFFENSDELPRVLAAVSGRLDGFPA